MMEVAIPVLVITAIVALAFGVTYSIGADSPGRKWGCVAATAVALILSVLSGILIGGSIDFATGEVNANLMMYGKIFGAIGIALSAGVILFTVGPLKDRLGAWG